MEIMDICIYAPIKCWKARLDVASDGRRLGYDIECFLLIL